MPWCWRCLSRDWVATECYNHSSASITTVGILLALYAWLPFLSPRGWDGTNSPIKLFCNIYRSNRGRGCACYYACRLWRLPRPWHAWFESCGFSCFRKKKSPSNSHTIEEVQKMEPFLYSNTADNRFRGCRKILNRKLTISYPIFVHAKHNTTTQIQQGCDFSLLRGGWWLNEQLPVSFDTPCRPSNLNDKALYLRDSDLMFRPRVSTTSITTFRSTMCVIGDSHVNRFWKTSWENRLPPSSSSAMLSGGGILILMVEENGTVGKMLLVPVLMVPLKRQILSWTAQRLSVSTRYPI